MIKHNINLFNQSFLVELRKLLAYRWEFWTGFLGQTFIFVGISYFLWKSIFLSNGVTEMHGIALTDFILYYLTAHLIFKTMLGPNIGFISHDIYYGTLNKFIVYPVSFQFIKIASYLAHSFFYYAQLIILISLHKLLFGNSVDLISFSLGSLTLITASYCYFLISASIELIAFWAENIWSLAILLRSFIHIGGGYLIPLSFYPEKISHFLYYTPFPYLIYEPIQIFRGQTSLEHFFLINAILLGWIFIAYIVFRLVWYRGNRQFTGVGI